MQSFRGLTGYFSVDFWLLHCISINFESCPPGESLVYEYSSLFGRISEQESAAAKHCNRQGDQQKNNHDGDSHNQTLFPS